MLFSVSYFRGDFSTDILIIFNRPIWQTKDVEYHRKVSWGPYFFFVMTVICQLVYTQCVYFYYISTICILLFHIKTWNLSIKNSIKNLNYVVRGFSTNKFMQTLVKLNEFLWPNWKFKIVTDFEISWNYNLIKSQSSLKHLGTDIDKTLTDLKTANACLKTVTNRLKFMYEKYIVCLLKQEKYGNHTVSLWIFLFPLVCWSISSVEKKQISSFTK